MKKSQKLLMTLLVIGVTGSLAGFGAFSAFSATTTNSNNQFTAGSVTIGSNDAGAAMFNAVTGGKPGTQIDRCIKVTYTGSLDSDVRLYTTDSSSGSLSQYVDVTITPGSFSPSPPAFPSCTNFVADSGGAIYTGTLSNFRTTKNSWANGVTDYPGSSATKWVTNDAVVYRFSYTIQSNDAAQGLTTGAHSYTWEARNQ